MGHRCHPKNVSNLTVDSAPDRIVAAVVMEMVSGCFFCRSEPHGLVTEIKHSETSGRSNQSQGRPG